MTHTINISPEALRPIEAGIKSFLLLKDDRNYIAGDMIIFQVLSERKEFKTEITCVEVETPGLKNGHILLGIKEKIQPPLPPKEQ